MENDTHGMGYCNICGIETPRVQSEKDTICSSCMDCMNIVPEVDSIEEYVANSDWFNQDVPIGKKSCTNCSALLDEMDKECNICGLMFDNEPDIRTDYESNITGENYSRLRFIQNEIERYKRDDYATSKHFLRIVRYMEGKHELGFNSLEIEAWLKKRPELKYFIANKTCTPLLVRRALRFYKYPKDQPVKPKLAPHVAYFAGVLNGYNIIFPKEFIHDTQIILDIFMKWYDVNKTNAFKSPPMGLLITEIYIWLKQNWEIPYSMDDFIFWADTSSRKSRMKNSPLIQGILSKCVKTFDSLTTYPLKVKKY